MDETLRPKQARFVAEYLIDLNATQAALRAGYSPRTARSIGYEHLTKPHISEAIHRAMARRSRRTEISAERVLQEIARLAYADPRRLYDATGHLKPVSDLDDDTAATVASVEVFEEYGVVDGDRIPIGLTKKIRLWNKTQNLTLLAKHLGLLREAEGVGDEFLEMLTQLVLKYVTDDSARQELATWVESQAHRPLLRDVTPARSG